MTSNGAGPYLTADRALGDGYWEAEAQKLDTDAKEGSNNEARPNEEDEGVLGNITIICATCNLKLFEHVYWLEADGWLFMCRFGSVARMRSTLFIHGICFRE